jgi:hypothetical protein
MQLVTSLNNPRGNLACGLTDLFGRAYAQRSTFELPEATSFWYFCHLCGCDKVSGRTIFTMCGYYLHRAQTTFFQTSLTCQPYHQTPTKMLHDHMAGRKYGSVLYIYIEAEPIWPTDRNGIQRHDRFKMESNYCYILETYLNSECCSTLIFTP